MKSLVPLVSRFFWKEASSTQGRLGCLRRPRPGPVSAFLSSRGDAQHKASPPHIHTTPAPTNGTSCPPNYLHLKVGSRGVENDMKAEFDDEQGMFEERAAQGAGVGQTFADAEQEYFEIGTDWSKRSEEGIIARNSFSAFPSRTC